MISTTAQIVAAYRRGFDRLPAAEGDPAADDLLAADVAGEREVDRGARMALYLEARTRFFDTVVTTALDRGVGQVVVAAAGYDGRSLRYARPGVRWFELDHPDTQQDKLDRLSRLGIAAPGVSFVAADFVRDDVAAALAAAGLDTAAPTLVTCEGVAVYLDLPVLHGLLSALRQAVGSGSRLAVSLSVDTGSPGQDERRREFDAAVAALGEPARSRLTAAQADALLADAGWHSLPPPEASRARLAGLVVAEAG